MARILLADDEAAARDLARRALEGDGHVVTAVQDGSDAIELIRSDPTAFDLLISDVQMPGMDGIALVREAAKLAPDLKMIVMSGFAAELDRATALGVLSLRTLAKPVSFEVLRREIRGIL